MSILGRYQIFGEMDAIADNRAYTCSVRCISEVGYLYCVKSYDFVRLLNFLDDTWENIVKNAAVHNQMVSDKYINIVN